MPWEPRGRRGLPYLSAPNPGAQLVASLNPRQGRKASAGNWAQRKVKAEYQIMTTRGQHRPAVRSIAANSRAQDRPQEVALRSCLAGTPRPVLISISPTTPGPQLSRRWEMLWHLPRAFLAKVVAVAYLWYHWSPGADG